MRVLVACEFSGVVREAFRSCGHDAWSCDLLPTENNSPHHYQNDVRDCQWDKFDMLLAFPPCTHLSVSGARWFKDKQTEQADAITFVRWLAGLPIERIAIENPIGILSTRWRKPDQIIQPWMFGEDASKATCLWLKNLPKLWPTDILPGGSKVRRANQTPSGQNKLGPSPTRAQERSRTYKGIAEAMAEQWGRG